MKKIEEQTKQILTELGIEKHLKGYKYWPQIIEYIVSKKLDSYKLFKETYVTVAKDNNISVSALERNLRYIIENREKQIQKYFKVNYKITNTSFIGLIIDRIESRGY